MIEVRTEPAARRVVAMMTGFLSVEAVARYIAQVRAEVAARGWASDAYDLLILTAEGAIQSREVMDEFSAAMHHAEKRPRRIAVVLGSVLSRMQTRRLLQERDGTALFATEADARGWLDDSRDAVAA